MTINFEAASIAWRANKVSIGNGSFKYVCSALTKKGKQCRNIPKKNCSMCRIHSSINLKIRK
tara:strand:- start:254 stop:439 length:186 start_codon:yes stop_codon:yes gene_type:complete